METTPIAAGPLEAPVGQLAPAGPEDRAIYDSMAASYRGGGRPAPALAGYAAWWALVMGAAAALEDAANCLTDPDAKRMAEGAAKHYRQEANTLWPNDRNEAPPKAVASRLRG